MSNKLSKCLALSAVAGALAVAGCGSSSDEGPSAEDAQKEYAQVSDNLTDFGAKLQAEVASIPGKSDAELAPEFDALAQEANKQIMALKEIEVPEDVTEARDNLADAIGDGVDDLKAIADAGKTHDADAAAASFKKLVADSQDIDAAKKELKEALSKAAN